MNKIKLKRLRPAFRLFTLDHGYPKLTSANGCCVTEMLRVCMEIYETFLPCLLV